MLQHKGLLIDFFQRSSFEECPFKTIRNNMNHRGTVITDNIHQRIKLGDSDLKETFFLKIHLLINIKILLNQCRFAKKELCETYRICLNEDIQLSHSKRQFGL